MHNRSIITVLSCALVLAAAENTSGAALPPSPFPMGQGGSLPMPGGPGGAMMPPGGGPGFDRMPTQAEMEAMQKEFEQFLSSLSPEDIKELEKMGEEFIKNNPDEAAKITGVPKEKLLAEISNKEVSTEQPLQAGEQPDMIDEDESPEQEPGLPQPGIKIPHKEEFGQKDEPTTPSTSAEKNALSAAIEGLLYHLEALQNKAASSTIIHQELRSYAEEIRDLIFYLSLINTDEHREQLASGKFATLVKAIIRFNEEFASKESIIPQPPSRMFDTPYDHLTLPFNATDKDIDQQYNKLAKKFTKKAVLKNLARDASETDKKRALKIARDSLELITDDYKQLKDPKLRALVDTQIRSEEEQFKEEALSTKNLVVAAIQVISAFIYQQKILDLLLSFLSEYEPVELQKRKELESAEKSQLEEQKKRFKRKGSRTPGGSFEPGLYTPGAIGPVSSYDGGPTGGFFGDTGISPSRGSSGWDKLFSPESTGSQQQPSPKTDSRDKDKKEIIIPKPSEAHQKAMKVDQRTPEQIIKDITRQFEKLNQEVSDEKTDKLFEKIEQEKQTALKKNQGQDDSANESKGENNGSEEKSSEKDGKEGDKENSGEEGKPKKDGVQGQHDKEDGKEGNKEDGKKSRKKTSGKKSVIEPKVKAEVISWRKKTLGLDTISSDLKKLLDKKSYEPKSTEKELALVKELFDIYQEPSKSKASSASTTAQQPKKVVDEEEEEATIPPGIKILKEKITKIAEDAPNAFYKTVLGKTEELINKINEQMGKLSQFYQYQQQALAFSDGQSESSEKKEERKKPH